MAEAVTIQDVYEELKEIKEKMATKEEMEDIVATIEILSNPETMEALENSKKDIKEGRVKKINSVKDLLKEVQDE